MEIIALICVTLLFALFCTMLIFGKIKCKYTLEEVGAGGMIGTGFVAIMLVLLIL